MTKKEKAILYDTLYRLAYHSVLSDLRLEAVRQTPGDFASADALKFADDRKRVAETRYKAVARFAHECGQFDIECRAFREGKEDARHVWASHPRTPLKPRA